jgi:hypothetical protein
LTDAEYISAAKDYMLRSGVASVSAAKKIMKAMIGLEGASIGVGGGPLHKVDADGARVVLKGLNLLTRKKR